MADEAKAPEKKSSPKRAIFIIGALLLVLAGGAAWYFTAKSAAAQPEAQQAEAKIVTVAHLESFVVNLADTDERAFLRVGIDLGLIKEPPSSGGHGGKSTLPVAEVRDTIIGVLSNWKAADLLTAEGKSKLKEQLAQALQNSVPELGVKEIYFTDFLVQR